ncbi:MAG: hypothetical protein JRI68_21770 [Deltaproteobacteria bacterium]|nr:hypothetical protein [Deltaproteobacteria bacterium]
MAGSFIALTTPRKLPAAAKLVGKVVVLDIAFASEGGGRRNSFERTTKRFIEGLGQRLVRWVDHHDSTYHRSYDGDERFVLATKAQHGACPEMITPDLVERAGAVDTIVCHNDFDGLASAAKWLCGGREPYPGCDDDARAIDTRVGKLGGLGRRFDRALRARPRDGDLALAILEHLTSRLASRAGWVPIDRAAAELTPLEEAARTLAEGYRSLADGLVFVDVTTRRQAHDRTLLLLLGQERATVAAVRRGDTTTFAAPFDSGVNLLERFGLSGGMPTLVSINRGQLAAALEALGVAADEAERLASRSPGDGSKG